MFVWLCNIFEMYCHHLSQSHHGNIQVRDRKIFEQKLLENISDNQSLILEYDGLLNCSKCVFHLMKFYFWFPSVS